MFYEPSTQREFAADGVCFDVPAGRTSPLSQFFGLCPGSEHTFAGSVELSLHRDDHIGSHSSPLHWRLCRRSRRCRSMVQILQRQVWHNATVG